MLDREQLQAASDLWYRHWRDGTVMPSLPERLRPATRAEAYAIQALLEQRTASPLFGWKIAATSRAGQAHIAVDGPLAGRILAEQVLEDGADCSLAGNRMRVAEPEFAFRMARDLPPRATPYAVDEVMDAVATLHPAIEVPDSRFADFTKVGAAQLIADNACAHHFLLGPATEAGWRGVDLARHPVTGTVRGKLERHGTGANVLDDPRLALTWLANELRSHGVTLGAGQVVTTGVCVVPLPVEPGDEVTAEFGPFGRASIRFVA
jgi:2-keto-4-pentenoate hydratase